VKATDISMGKKVGKLFVLGKGAGLTVVAGGWDGGGDHGKSRVGLLMAVIQKVEYY
jgi:hypothetical protein